MKHHHVAEDRQKNGYSAVPELELHGKRTVRLGFVVEPVQSLLMKILCDGFCGKIIANQVMPEMSKSNPCSAV